MKDEMAYIMRAIILAGIFCLGTLMDVGAQSSPIFVDVYGLVQKQVSPNECVPAVGEVKVYDNNDTLLGSTTSDESGEYEICDIDAVNRPLPWRVVATIPNWGTETKYIYDFGTGNHCGNGSKSNQVDFCILPKNPNRPSP